MLCPPFTIGYALDRKVWCRLFVDLLEPIQWRPSPMDDLILPDKQKKVLRALVGSHVFPNQARDEWGLKGKGLVILLHGTPGTGKTLTAGMFINASSHEKTDILIVILETAAEYTKKALLKISLSELKADERLEDNMLRFQRYSSTWKAIILVDEADVFLEARTTQGSGSADRNGLVAGMHLPFRSFPFPIPSSHSLSPYRVKNASLPPHPRILPRYNLPHLQPRLCLRSSHQIPHPPRPPIRRPLPRLPPTNVADPINFSTHWILRMGSCNCSRGLR